MKIGIIFETKDCEKAWNAMRFALAAMNSNQVKVFLLGDPEDIETLIHEKYDVSAQVSAFIRAGGEILTDGAYLHAGEAGAEDLPDTGMKDCVEMAEWADKVISF